MHYLFKASYLYIFDLPLCYSNVCDFSSSHPSLPTIPLKWYIHTHHAHTMVPPNPHYHTFTSIQLYHYTYTMVPLNLHRGTTKSTSWYHQIHTTILSHPYYGTTTFTLPYQHTYTIWYYYTHTTLLVHPNNGNTKHMPSYHHTNPTIQLHPHPGTIKPTPPNHYSPAPFQPISQTPHHAPHQYQVMCGVWIFTDYGMTFASKFTMVAISLDRCWCVVWSIHYRAHNNNTKMVRLIIFIW